MSSDDAYSSFLDKANQDAGDSGTATKSTSGSVRIVNTEIPASLQRIEQYYTSEADEPFEPVSLKWDGKQMPSSKEFQQLLKLDSEVETLEMEKFDPHKQYQDIVNAVEGSSEAKATVFRTAHGKTRVEYYVVGFDKDMGRVVGMKATAVES